MKRTILFYYLFISLPVDMQIPLFLQADDFEQTSFNVEDGLPTNMIKSVCQDSEGYIWIATDDGVSKYNGIRFTNFLSGLPSNYCKSVLCSQDKQVYLITDMGISYLKDNQFELLIPGKDIQTEGSLFYPKSLYIDTARKFWISEPNAIVRYQSGELKRYLFPEEFRADSYERSFLIFEDSPNHLIAIAHNGAVFQFNPFQDAFLPIPSVFDNAAMDSSKVLINAEIRLPDGHLLAGGSDGIYELQFSDKHSSMTYHRLCSISGVSSICVLENLDLMVGTWSHGLYIVHPPYDQSQVFEYKDVVHKNVNTLFVSKEGAVWVCTTDGINILQSAVFNHLEKEFPNPFMTSVVPGEEGSMYASDGTFLYRITEKNAAFTVKKIFTKSESSISAIGYRHGIVYIGYRDGFIDILQNGKTRRITLPEKGNRVIFYLYADQQQNLWACQNSLDGVYRITPDGTAFNLSKENGLASHINYVLENQAGDLFLAGDGMDSFLYRWNPEQNRCDTMSPLLPEPVSSFSVAGFAFDKEQAIWAVTSNGVYLIKNQIAKPLEMNLETDIGRITAIASDEQSIWIGANRGLIRYVSGEFVTYGLDTGLPSSTINSRGLVFDSKGQLWAGTANGLAYGKKTSFPVKKTYTPFLFSLHMNNNPVENQSVFPYFSFLDAEFGSLIYPSRHVIYQYRIDGLISAWSKPSTNTTLLMHNLPEGKFTLCIRAQKTGYTWSEPVQLAFSVDKPFYRSEKAILLYFLIAVIIIISIVLTIRTLRDRKKTRFQLQESEKRFRNLVDTAGSIILCMDSSRNLFEMNHEAELFFQVTKSWMMGKSYRELFSLDEYGNAFEEQMEKVIQGMQIRDFINPMQIKVQQPLFILWNLTPMRDAQNRIMGIIAIGQDITGMRAMEEELKKARDIAESANQAKTEFLAKMSHELRTPLNSVIGFSQILLKNRENHLSEKEMHYLGCIRHNGSHLLNLINDVLDIATLESGKVAIQKEKVSVIKLIQEIVELFERQTQQKGIFLQIEIPDKAESIESDPSKLKQILINLVANAVKFTESGGIILRLFVDPAANIPSRLHVIDSGIGIPQESLDRIFEAFKQVDSGTKRKYEGTGLGLNICQSLCHLLGYKITVISELGQGSTFTIHFS